MKRCHVVVWRALHWLTIVALVVGLTGVPAVDSSRLVVVADRAFPAADVVDSPESSAGLLPPDLLRLPDRVARADIPQPSPVPIVISNTIGPGGGIVASSDGRVFLSFPPGAIAETITVTISPGQSDAATPPSVFYLFAVQATDARDAPVSRFARPVTATVFFRPDDLVGRGEGSPVLFWLDEAKGAWQTLGGQVDWGQGLVTVAINHLSTFGAGVATSISFGAQDLPSVHGFVSDDWSGNSSLHYPLLLPPGSGKLNLSLSLDYSSENVNAATPRASPVSSTIRMP